MFIYNADFLWKCHEVFVYIVVDQISPYSGFQDIPEGGGCGRSHPVDIQKF